MLDKIDLETFDKCLNTKFTIQIDDATSAELELIEVSPLTGADSSNEARKPFSLLFRGSPDLALEQQMHELKHPELGNLAVFMVPLAPDKQGSIFECVFN